MTVAVSAGNGLVRATPTGGNAQHFNVRSDASENVTIASNASGSTVYDFIYIQLAAATLNNPNVTGTDAMTYVTQRSTTQYVDSNGALTNGELIAEVTVVNGAASIANASIADRRRQAAIVGSGGWREMNDSSLAYASATTLTTSAGSVFKYSVGTKLRIRQAGSIKYFYITGVADTLLTITGGSDYTLTNVAIGASAYSLEAAPVGFPQYFNYTPTYTGTTLGNGTVTGKFVIEGRTVKFRSSFTLGSTSAVTGSIIVSLPATASSGYTNGLDLIGQADLNDNGVADYHGPIRIQTSTTALVIVNLASGTYSQMSALNSTTPFSWGNTDRVALYGDYEIA